MALVEIKFAPWSMKSSLQVEVGDEVNPIFRLRSALEIVVGEIKEGKRESADLSDADLRGADLRDAVLRDAVLSGADLRDADLRGAVLRDAVLSGADLRDAVLSGADLRDAVLRDAVLSGADLRDADLSGADLRDAVLSGADLSGADLRDADLSGADLSGAVLREILEKEVPLIPNIDAAILASIEKNKAAGTNGLDMGSWHGKEDIDETNWCGTTHCRAGYAICLAGKEGFALEKKYGSATAGMLLYMKSTPDAKIPNFYTTDERAMADLRERAAKQTSPSGA